VKAVIAHGALALLGLLFAFQTWTREEEAAPEAPGSATVFECAEDKLAKVEIETPTHTVSIRREAGKSGPEFWVTTQRKKLETEKKEEAPSSDPEAAESKPEDGKAADAKAAGEQPADAKAADAKATDGPADAPPAEKPARPYDPDAPVSFLASAKFEPIRKQLTPLRALRGLGDLPKDKFPAFGFDKVGTYLRLECGGKKMALDIGGRTFGVGNQYARDPKTKQAYLLDGTMLMDLQSAQFKFMQTELHAFTLTEADEATIKALDKERRLVHRNRLVAEEARWVDATEPDKRNELFGNWFQRVQRLKAKAYLPEGAAPGSDLQIEGSPPKPAVTVEYKLEGKPKGKLELVMVETTQGNFYYARSETTRRWVSLFDSTAKQVADDAALVVGAEEPPASSVPASSMPEMPAGHPPIPAANPAPAPPSKAAPGPAAAPAKPHP
jgi:hypothetical protein